LAAVMILGTAVVAVTVGAAFHLSVMLDQVVRQKETCPIAVSSRKLEFGDVPFHGAVIRHLVLRSDGEVPVRAWFFASGPGYRVEPRDVILEPGVETRVIVSVSAERPGRLSGELLVHVDDGGGPLLIPLLGRSPAVGEEPRETVDMNRLRARTARPASTTRAA
jgi:hypothetical protein